MTAAPSTHDVRIRALAEADLDRVLEIAGSLAHAPHWTRAAYLAALDPRAAMHRIALAAEETRSGTLAGFAVASVLPPQAELETVAVDERYQRREIGRKLMAEMALGLKSMQVTEVTLEVRESNAPALGLYGSFGFGETGRRPRYYTDPVEDAVLLRLLLK